MDQSHHKGAMRALPSQSWVLCALPQQLCSHPAPTVCVAPVPARAVVLGDGRAAHRDHLPTCRSS